MRAARRQAPSSAAASDLAAASTSSPLMAPNRCAVLSACRGGERICWLYAAANDPGRLVFMPEGGTPSYYGHRAGIDALIFFSGGCDGQQDAVRAPDAVLALNLIDGSLDVSNGHATFKGSVAFLAGSGGRVRVDGGLETHRGSRTLTLSLAFPEAPSNRPVEHMVVPLDGGLAAILKAAAVQAKTEGVFGADLDAFLKRLKLTGAHAGDEVSARFVPGLFGHSGEVAWKPACDPSAPSGGKPLTAPSGDSPSQVALLAFGRGIRGQAAIDALGLHLDRRQMPERLDLVQYPTFPWWPAQRSAPRDGFDWVLELHGIPSKAVFAAWNQQVADPYRHALRTAERSGAVSFLPNLETTSGANGEWVLRWLVRGEDGQAPRSLEAVNLAPAPAASPAPGIEAIATFIGCLTHQRGEPLALNLVLGDPTAVPTRQVDRGRFTHGLIMNASVKARSAPAGPAALSSPPPGASRLAAQVDAGGNPRAWIDLELPLAHLRPGGEDDVPVPVTAQEAAIRQALADTEIDREEEEALRLLLDREAPLIMPRRQPWRSSGTWVRLGAFDLDFDPTAPTAYFLRAMESNESNHFLSLQVRFPETPGAGSQQQPQDVGPVVVLDRDPFLVAEVCYPDLARMAQDAEATVFATWSNQGADGPGWQLLSDQQPFDLVLPPQGLGEQMIKAMETQPARPHEDPGPVMDFRLAPPAHLGLKAGALPTRFTDAPWNLRRVLGYPGQRIPGAGVASLSFELLYGLACQAKPKDLHLRLAETFALLGAIREPLPPVMAWAGSPPQERRYRQLRRRWAALTRRYHGRLAVLQPWTSLQAAKLVLDRGLSCSFRRSASLAIPPDPTADPAQPNYDGLKGGATWGFEQKNVFQVTMHFPDSSSAQLVDPMFSSLGGWGTQKAGFQRDLSSVVTNVEMGRTSSYAVERIGRIGVFWNLAKHVILYERSAVPSKQFYDTQPWFLGRPLLRKVEEYIEVMEPRRSYPEDAAHGRLAPGFLSAIQFLTVKIPVDPRWGANVGAAGWKIPLWSRNVAPDKADVYPKPHVVFEVAAQEEGKPCISTVELDEPEKLCFYTLTTLDAAGDPHLWPCEAAVDRVDLPRPAVRPGEFPTPLRTLGPAELAVPRGHEPFTFAVGSSAKPANVVSQRSPGAALSAEIKNVTMMRQGPALPSWDGKSIVQPADVIHALDAIEKVMADWTVHPPPPGAMPESLAPARDAARALVGHTQELLTADLSKVQSQVRDRERALAAAYVEQARAVFAEVAGLADEAEQAVAAAAGLAADALAARLDEVRHDLIAAVEDARERLKSLAVQPEAFLAAVDEVQRGANRLSSEAADLAQLAGAAGTTVAELRQRVRQMSSLAAGVRTAILHKADGWGIDPTALLGAALRNFADTATQLDAALAAPSPSLTAIRQQLVALSAAMNQAEQDVAAAFALVQPPALAPAAELHLDQLVQYLKDAAPTEVAGLLKEAAGWLRPDIAAAEAAAALDRASSAVKAVSGAAKTTLNELQDRATAWQSLLGDIDSGSDWLNRWTDFQKAAATFTQDLLPHLAAPAGAVLQVVEAGEAAAGPALEMVRAFGLPPAVQGLTFDLPNLAYYFSSSDPNVGITPVLGLVDAVKDIRTDPLKALGTQLPSTQLLDRLLPAGLERFNLSEVLPNFSGLKLANLFPSVQLPKLADPGESLHVTHGADPQSGRAWLDATIDLGLPEPAGIFALGPLSLRVVDAHLDAAVRIEVTQAASTTQSSGSITGQWEVIFGGMTLVTFVDTTLTFDEGGHLHFGLSADRMRMAPALGFLTDALKAFAKPGSGLTLGILPAGGVRCTLDLPIPPIQAGTFGISNLRLGAELSLLLGDQRCPELGIGVGFSVGRHDAPFNLAVCILGGSGYIEATALYGPFNQYIDSTVDIGIYASASLGISLGPINGFVYVGFGVTAQYRSPGAGLNAGINVLVRGGVSVLGFIDALVCLSLSGTYRADGTVVALGQLSMSFRISWLFTLTIDESVEYHLAGHSSSGSLPDGAQGAPVRLASLGSEAAARTLAAMEPTHGPAGHPGPPPLTLEEAAAQLLAMYVLEDSDNAP